ncbi:MAG TPA: hypothetical protein VFG78_10550 [Gemmatimonadota bacterium]|nr:hypothetical protein [Gemmatimonadota bacterium]
MTIESALLVQALGEYSSTVSSSEVSGFLSRTGNAAFDFVVDHKWLIGGLAVGLYLFLKSVFE